MRHALRLIPLLFLSAACDDHLGTERAEIVKELASLQEECDELRIIPYRVEAVEEIVTQLHEDADAHVAQLRTMEGCEPPGPRSEPPAPSAAGRVPRTSDRTGDRVVGPGEPSRCVHPHTQAPSLPRRDGHSRSRRPSPGP